MPVRGRLRAHVETVLVAAAIVAAVCGAAFAAEAAGLPRPPRADRVAANAVGSLLRHRLTTGFERIDGGPPQRFLCLRGWLPVGGGAVDRGDVLALGGRRLVLIRGVLHSYGGPPPREHVALIRFAAAGCPLVVGPRLGAAIENGATLTARPDVHDGIAAFQVQFRTRVAQFAVFVTRRGDVPFAIDVRTRTGRSVGSGRFRLTRATPALLRAVLSGIHTSARVARAI